MSDPETLSVYDRKAVEYRQLLGADPASNAALAGFIAALPLGARVLDLGCGPGTWARQMLAAGLQVDAVDASSGMVAEAQKIKDLTVWQARFDELDGAGPYHGIWANFSLLHAPKAEMPGHLARLRSLLVPGGLMHIGLKQGSGEARDVLGRFYAYYTPTELTDLLADEGMTVSDPRQGADRGLDGTVAAWFTLLAHG